MLGDVLVRVARRAGIVVIFERELETKRFSNSVSVLKAPLLLQGRSGPYTVKQVICPSWFEEKVKK